MLGLCDQALGFWLSNETKKQKSKCSSIVEVISSTSGQGNKDIAPLVLITKAQAKKHFESQIEAKTKIEIGESSCWKYCRAQRASARNKKEQERSASINCVSTKPPWSITRKQ